MSIFDQTKYDPSLYESVKNNYQNNLKYKINDTECLTLFDFDELLWDAFADFAEKHSYNILFGAFGLKNRNPNREAQKYYDGLVYYLTQQEFKECVTDNSVSRFLSLLMHWGYGFKLELLK